MPAHVDDDASANRSSNDRAGPIQRRVEGDDLAHGVDCGGIEILRDSGPRRPPQADARAHAFDAEQRDAAQNERRDIRRKLHAADIAAGGDGPIEARLRKKIGESDAADSVDADSEALLLQRLSGSGQFVAADDLGCAEASEIGVFDSPVR